MPKIEIIEAGAYDPDEEVVVKVTVKGLTQAVKDAAAKVDEIRQARAVVRETAPRSEVLSQLAETEEEFQAAIDALNEAERDLGRWRRKQRGQEEGEAQVVHVGGASEKGEVH